MNDRGKNLLECAHLRKSIQLKILFFFFLNPFFFFLIWQALNISVLLMTSIRQCLLSPELSY